MNVLDLAIDATLVLYALAILLAMRRLFRGPRAQDRVLALDFIFVAAMLMMLAGSLYRFDTYLVAFRPGDQWSYFPSIPELLITIGLVSAEIMVYVVVIKVFPILSGAAPAAAERAGAGWARTLPSTR